MLTRFASAKEHFIKGQKLAGIGDEMGVVRFIAAEEELVVGIFEVFKIRSDELPEHRDFVERYRDHLVKPSFYPVLYQMSSIVEKFLRNGISTHKDGIELKFKI
ncbi:MAG: hypothetical protein ACPGPC_07070 [Alphaproteobacteria bacterium]